MNQQENALEFGLNFIECDIEADESNLKSLLYSYM